MRSLIQADKQNAILDQALAPDTLKEFARGLVLEQKFANAFQPITIARANATHRRYCNDNRDLSVHDKSHFTIIGESNHAFSSCSIINSNIDEFIHSCIRMRISITIGTRITFYNKRELG